MSASDPPHTPLERTPAELAHLEALKRGDQVALERFVIDYQGRVYRLCLRVMRDETEAEDMAQETFLRACKALPTFRAEAGLSTWLFRIALNVCRNRHAYLKRRHHGRHVSTEELLGDHWQLKHASAQSPEARSIAEEEVSHLERAFESLSDDHRLLLNLRDSEDLSYQEISEVTSWPEGTIKSKLHRARKQLSLRYQALQEGRELTDEPPSPPSSQPKEPT